MEMEHLYDNIPGPPDTVLIIDDDEINRAILDNLFSETYVIQEAENGRIGLEKILAQRDRICAVLLDVVMPEMDGIQVMRALNERNIQEQIPVFLITAEAVNDTYLKANSQEHGVESYGMVVDLMLGWFEETVPCEGAVPSD